MRDTWWSTHYKKSNGYFGCETTRDAGQVTGVNTWVYFEFKLLPKNMHYYWTKLNVFTRWVEATKQTFILLFDPNPSILETVPASLRGFNPALLGDPYWPYPILLDTVANLQEAAVWLIRDQVRDIEKVVPKPGTVPNPDYRRLHDIARHAIHVCESLDVAVQTIESVQMHYLKYTGSKPQHNDPAFDQDLRAQLEFYRGFIANLRHRSTSNEKRLQNEIQLAFNTVAQHNAGTSVEIGRAAQIDSSAMKTIAFVTLIFLPPTFISSIFSMSFFQAGDNNGWGLSSKFWLYWVFAIPTTIATVLIWRYWHKLFPTAGYKHTSHEEDLPTALEVVEPKLTV
ncbi:uncharacterized protein N7506_007147 [Penicillium brevicompactum]|uniref:uncharacterized protein n=1 Tax=Penicillium brevicompactum TaxID=5074 RepID=UPI0025409BB0|nr:uncharacterized protein N7506_007147 [Penicillium brevicompactum]KAJ5333364.1 hypothetical protein N7506_007147 [Penicillium brevicompactum]